MDADEAADSAELETPPAHDDEPISDPSVLAVIISSVAVMAICQDLGSLLLRLDPFPVMMAAQASSSSSRRDYSVPPRFFSREWWTASVPYFRQFDEKRFVRNFRIPSVLMDEIVSKAELHDTFAVSARVAGHAETTSKKVHMTLWRMGRAASLSDCCEQFAVSEGFVVKWTPIVLKFIISTFGHRLWGRE